MITLFYIRSMKRIQIPNLPMTCLAVTLLFAGCNRGQRTQGSLIDDVDTSGSEQSFQSFNQVFHLYPSPAEMLSIIDLNEMTYDETLLNPVAKWDEYLDTRAKTQMLGVYMTDLAYCALFGRHEATLDYLEVVRTLADEIRIDKAVDDAMILKARENVEFLDSLYTISNQAFMNTLAFCERNDRANTVVMMSAGAFTESLYLAVNLIDDYSTADRLLQHLADQKYTIDNFMTFAESVRGSDPNVASTIEGLQQIHLIYDGIDPGTGDVTIKSESEASGDGPKKLVIGGTGTNERAGLSEEEFNELKAAVIELRNSLVNV